MGAIGGLLGGVGVRDSFKGGPYNTLDLMVSTIYGAQYEPIQCLALRMGTPYTPRSKEMLAESERCLQTSSLVCLLSGDTLLMHSPIPGEREREICIYIYICTYIWLRIGAIMGKPTEMTMEHEMETGLYVA